MSVKFTSKTNLFVSLSSIAAALIAGALSGLRIGKDALGAELAAYMGGLYGFLSGSVAVVVTTIILMIV